eukprot:g27323.t1
MENSDICVEHANMLGYFEIKKEMVLVLLKIIKVDKSAGPNATGEVPEDWQAAGIVPLFKKRNREVMKVINEGSAMDIIDMDFSKNFNKVPHGWLIQKIKVHGVHATQADRVVKKVYGMLAFIGQGIEYKSQDVMLQLYKTFVRTHLEYCINFWLRNYRKDMEALRRLRRDLIEVYKIMRCIDRVD